MMGWSCPGYGISGGGWGRMGVLGMLPGLLLLIGMLVLAAIAVVWLIRQFRHSRMYSGAHGGNSDPLSIAQRRLATGEITTSEYEEIRSRIQE